MYYAQIDSDGLCFAVLELSDREDALDMIPIDSYDRSLLGKRWNGETWEDVPDSYPAPPPETTEQKLARLEEQNLILMDALATTFEELLTLRAMLEGGSS